MEIKSDTRAVHTRRVKMTNEPLTLPSGMAAITSSLLAFLKSGDEVIASNSLYGRTQIFMQQWLPRFGIKVKLVPVEEFPSIDRYFSPETRIV
jgi:cystathionine beta-lyase/cystathionine gamma-synthase